MMKNEKKVEMHPFLILGTMLILMAILTHIIPAGTYERPLDPVSGQRVLDPESFHFLEEENPVSVFDIFTSIHDGIVNGAGIYSVLFLLGGSIFVVEKTGAIKVGVQWLVKKSEGKRFLLISILLLFFTTLGAIGFGEGALPFYMMTIYTVMSLGYDRLAGFAVPTLGICIGWSSGVLNILTTGIGQKMVGLKLFSGLGYRFFGLFIFFVISILYLKRYCDKIVAHPEESLTGFEEDFDYFQEEIEGKLPHYLTLIGLGAVFLFQGVGALKWNWAMPQIGALYLMLLVFVGVIFRLPPVQTCRDFLRGAGNMLQVALCISLAQGITLIMKQGQILDTIVHAGARLLQGKSVFITLVLMFLFVTIFNFFVLSGPGKAVLMMPILSPLGKILKINQQVMILIYNYGDGFTNQLYPTSGSLLASLEMCKVRYDQWIKFFFPLAMIYLGTALMLIVVAYLMNYGPF